MTALFIRITHNAENFWGDDAPSTLRHWSHRVLGFSRDVSGQRPYESVCWSTNCGWEKSRADQAVQQIARLLDFPDPRFFDLSRA